MELAHEPDDAGLAEDEVEDTGELAGPRGEEPAEVEEALGGEVIVGAVLGSPRGRISRDGSQQSLETKPVGQVVSDADSDVEKSGQ